MSDKILIGEGPMYDYLARRFPEPAPEARDALKVALAEREVYKAMNVSLRARVLALRSMLFAANAVVRELKHQYAENKKP